MKTLLYEHIRPMKLMILVHNDLPPSDEEWDPYIEALHSTYFDYKLRRVLVMAEGPGPNAVQREKLHHRQREGRPLNTAIISHSIAHRGIVTALSWFYEIKAFSPLAMNDAFRYLELPTGDWMDIRKFVGTMRMRLLDSTTDGALSLGDTIGTLDELATERLPRLRERMRRPRIG